MSGSGRPGVWRFLIRTLPPYLREEHGYEVEEHLRWLAAVHRKRMGPFRFWLFVCADFFRVAVGGSMLIMGWLVFYIVCSIPVLMFYAAGLSGWFSDYPIGLFVAIFLLLATPLLLILLKSPHAPQWNIAMVWVASILITLRIIYGVLFQAIQEGRPRVSGEELLDAMPTLLGIVVFSLGWAMVWTRFLKKSV